MSQVWLPSIEEETSKGKMVTSVYSRLLKSRKVFLTGEINESMANDIVSQLMVLQAEDESKEIDLYINSGGGSIISGMMIYDCLKAISCPVNMYCMGMAASMAAIIFSGGEKGRRYILQHAKTMIHEPRIGEGLGGSASSISEVAESLNHTREITNGILAENTGNSLEEINECTKKDKYMDAEESIEFGIADEIIYKI